MNRRASLSLLAFFAVVILLVVGGIHIRNYSAKASPVSFSFGTGGDHGNHPDSQGVFEAAGQSGISFFQTNGDMSYLDSPTNNINTATAEWCSMVNTKLGSIPFLALSGNHEEPGHGGTDGDDIDEIIANGCLPKPASMNVVESPLTTGSAGTTPTNYGREYYYDYPSVNPIARFIAVSADIDTYVGGNYDYSVGSAHYNWVQARIQEAKASGMWVIVVNHTPIMNTGGSHGGTNYSTVTPLFNLAIDEKVDLFLSGHEHNYQRSKQIGGTSCNYTFNTYSANCIADANANTYTAGNGTVAVITGSTGGNYNTGDGLMIAINTSDPDYQYFATTMGRGSANETRGFSKFDVTETSITGHFVAGVGQTGGFTDTFTITRTDTTDPSTILTSPTDGSTVSGSLTLTATATDDTAVTLVEFYQNGTKIGEDATEPFSFPWDTTLVANGDYSLTTKAYDAAGNIGNSTTVLAHVANGAPTDTTNPTVSLTAPVAGSSLSGTVSLTASASDNVGVTKVEFYNGTTKIGEDTSSPYLYDWDTAGVPNGAVSLSAKAYDAAGNIGTSTSVSASISNSGTTADTSAPSVSLTAPVAGSSLSGTVSLTASASDNVGVTKVEFYNGTTKLGEDSSNPYAFSWDTAGLSNGSATLTAKAYDAAGNATTSANVPVTINHTSTQTGSFEVTNADGVIKSTVSLTGSCTTGTTGSAKTLPSELSGQTMIVGLGFQSTCAASGGSATVAIDLGKVYDHSILKIMKTQSDNSLKDITSSVTMTDKDTGTVLSYSVTDGSSGDSDGVANGTLIDPVYILDTSSAPDPASASSLQDTGTIVTIVGAVAISIIGCALTVQTRKNSRYKIYR